MKKLSILLSLFAMILSYSLKAQLSGSYTIGGSSANYATISAAISDLNSQGVSSSVVFQIASGTYNEQITIGNISGASLTNTIEFTSASGDSTDVIIANASSGTLTNNYTIKLNAAKHIIFSKITIERSGTNTYSVVVENSGISENIKFIKCVIKNSSLQSISTFTSLFYSQNNLSIDFLFENNRFENGSYGIYFEGVSSSASGKGDNLQIINNLFNNQWRSTIYSAFQFNPKIENNLITSNSTYFNYSAAHLFYCDNGIRITNNVFNINKSNGIKLSNSFGSSGNLGLIQNNFISVAGDNTSAIDISSSGFINIYFNSINVYGNSSVGISLDGSVSSNIRFVNNIIKNSGGYYTINVNSGATNALVISDYNNLYSSGTSNFASYNGQAISSINAWKSASSKDANSVSYNTTFVSNTDLHVTSTNIAQKASFSLNSPFLNTDIDGQTRNPLIPDIGADEFSIADLELTSLNIDSFQCEGPKKRVQVYVKNNGTVDFNTNVFVSYKYGNDPIQTEALSYTSLASNDSVLHSFSNKIDFAIGLQNLQVWLSSNVDIDSSNDSINIYVTTNAKPSVNLGNDKIVCAHDSVLIDAGFGFDYYLWSDGSTSQTVYVDSMGIGLSPTFFGVEISLNSCTAEDSVLIIFKDCTSLEDISDNEKIQLFPNPADNKINVSFNDIEFGDAEIRIYNINSQLVLKNDFSSDKTIDISSLKPGYYFVSIRNDKYELKKSFIINR